jgi:hypothetical protein
MTKFCIELEDMALPDAIAAVVEAWLDAQSEEPSKSQTQDDAIKCLHELFNQEMPASAGRTFRECFVLFRDPGNEKLLTTGHPNVILGRHGIKLTDAGLVLSNSMEFIYGGTKWRNGGHRECLRNLHGAQATNGAVHFTDSGSSRGTVIPWSYFA